MVGNAGIELGADLRVEVPTFLSRGVPEPIRQFLLKLVVFPELLWGALFVGR